MIFSRLRIYLRERKYGVLFLEFIILVVGVYLSLQANQWQNNRQNRAIEQQYLVRLEKDFERSSTALSESIARIELAIEKLELSLVILSNEKREEGDYQKLFDAMQSSSIMGSFEVYLATFEELKDTGYMRLLESTELRESLGNVWQKHVTVSRISEIRNVLRGNAFPIMAKYVKPLNGNKLTIDAESLGKDPREIYVAMSIIRSNLRYDLNDSEHLLALIDQTLHLVRTQID
jgi:hypothetical protein